MGGGSHDIAVVEGARRLLRDNQPRNVGHVAAPKFEAKRGCPKAQNKTRNGTRIGDNETKRLATSNEALGLVVLGKGKGHATGKGTDVVENGELAPEKRRPGPPSLPTHRLGQARP